MAEETQFTHKAIARYRYRNSYGWIELGDARFDLDALTGQVTTGYVVLKTMPVGGFDGYLRLLPVGTPPPPVQSEPKRPAPSSENEEAQEI